MIYIVVEIDQKRYGEDFNQFAIKIGDFQLYFSWELFL